MTYNNFEKNCNILENYLLQSCKVCNHKKGQRFSEDSTCDCRNKFCCGVRLIYGCVPLDLIITAYSVKPAYDKEEIMYFAENPKEVYEKGLSLYLHGDLGVGKTLCSVLLAINFVNAFSEGGKCGYKHRVSIRFMEAFNFIDRIRMLQSSNEELSKFKESFNATLFILKYWVGMSTGSIAIVADAWHTLSDSLSPRLSSPLVLTRSANLPFQ